jgi:tetraacyldisaccharide 4'-kinase
MCSFTDASFFVNLVVFKKLFMIKLLLYPFSLLYGFAVYLRNQLFDLNLLKSREFDIPVISVGNITVGGTGKTPHIEYLVRLLKDNFEVATLSRGYKRKTKGFRKVELDSTVNEAGDEPLQLKRKFPEITVSVCEKRVPGVEQLIQENTQKIPDVILLDDAFQHRNITPGINILLIDYNRPVKEDMLLPAGRLRESKFQMRRANIIIFTKCPSKIAPIKRRTLQKDVQLKPYQELFFTSLAYEKIQPVYPENGLIEIENLKEYTLLVVTGIASPKPVHNYLKTVSNEIKTKTFPDHYYFSANDIEMIMSDFSKIESKKKIIVTTEKDALRFKNLSSVNDAFKNALYYLPVHVKFLDKEGKLFNKKIINYVGENKSNSELHKRKNQRKS